MSLKADADLAGKTVKCPGCGTKLQIPEEFADQESAPQLNVPGDSEIGTAESPTEESAYTTPQRQGWTESDHANVNMWASLGIAAIIFGACYGIFIALKTTFIGSVFFSGKSGTIVNCCELFLFAWAFGILILKMKKVSHQKNAMLLDALPADIDSEINRGNVGKFIDHVYSLPNRLRDSTMVNRIRKALEFFETRQNNGEVASLMTSQSEIDASRIQGSYSLLKVFLWAVPILGFIGTVLGLSESIAGFGSIDASDTAALTETIGKVTSGLGTAFNTTLFGLVLSVIMSFPISAVQKTEEDNLNVIDSYCNENLLTRLNDGAGVAGGDNVGALDSIGTAIAGAQKEFLHDLNELSKMVKSNAEGLERRADEHQKKVEADFSERLEALQKDASRSVDESTKTVTKYLTGLDTGIRRLNDVLESLGEKQVVVQQVKKKGWFG